MVHLAFDHSAFQGDFSKFADVCLLDKNAIEALGEGLDGSTRLMLVSAGVGITPGRPKTEEDPVTSVAGLPRVSEDTANSLAAKGARVSTVRLPQVHDRQKQGLITYFVEIARKNKESAYIGEGLNGWAAAHVLDVARLYRLALEKGDGGARYHAVAEERVPIKDIVEAVGKTLKLPVVKSRGKRPHSISDFSPDLLSSICRPPAL